MTSRSGRRLGLALLVTLAVGSSSLQLSAKPVVSKKNYFELGASGWAIELAEAVDTAERVLATAVHDSKAASATLIRINYPNTPAWRKKKYYFDDVERGLRNATEGYVLQSKKQGKLGRVPILDIRYRRTHESAPHVAVRFLFFRTFTLIVSAQSDRRQRAAASKLARSLKPHF